MASNITFRDKYKTKAYQRIIRERKEKEGKSKLHEHVNLSLKDAVVKPVTYRFAKKIILEYEWLGTMATSNYHYGIFFDHLCGGVVCFAVGGGGANLNAADEFGVRQDELAYLARGACTYWSPSGTASKLISYALKFVAKQTNTKVALAYADTDAGEIGTVYQATNWYCIGKGDSITQFIAPNGRVYDQKLIYNLRIRAGKEKFVSWTKQRDYLLSKGWKEQKTNPKWRYCFILAQDKNKEMIYNRIKDKIVEYPKRNAGIV